MGTEAFWVPAALAAVGTGAQYINQNNANKRQQASEVQAIGNQQQIRGNANAQVKQLTDQIAQNTPAQLQGKETGEFVKTLRQNSAGKNPSDTNFGQSTSALAPVPSANSRYNSDTAASQKQVQDFGQTNASELSAVDSAVRQRQNEGLAMQTLGSNLQGLNLQSQTQNFVDQLRSQAKGQANPWVSLFGKLATNAGQSMATNGFGAKTPGLTSQYSGGYQPTAGSAVDFVSG